MTMKLVLLCLCCVSQLQGIKIVSYNTGLLDSLQSYAERKHGIIASLQRTNFDVMCLQEVFYGNDVMEIEARLRWLAKSFYLPLTQEKNIFGAKTAPCAAALARGTINCILTQCASMLQGEYIKCAFSICRIGLESQACLSCLVYDNRNMKKRCFMDSGSMNIPGLMLLSRRPVIGVKYEFFEEPSLKLLTKRAFITAEITGLGTVICTHQTANLGREYLETTLRDRKIYSSYAEQHLAETKKLTSKAKSSGRSAIIVGDLNTSPDSTRIAPAFEDSFDHYIEEGFSSPYFDIDGRCTFCKGNYLANKFTMQNFVLDHVLIKSDSHVVNTCRRRDWIDLAAERILEGHIILGGRPTPLSDHFAVSVDILPLRRRENLK